MDEKILRDFAIQACNEMLDAFYDSGFNPAYNWNEMFLNTYDKLVKNYKNNN